MGDIKVFRVTSTNPANFQKEVNTVIDIKIQFNTDADTKTLSNGITVLSKNDSEVVHGSTSYNNRVLTFRPSVPFKQGIEYDVYIKSSIKNILGMSCKAYSFSFTTKVGVEYTSPVLIYPSNESILDGTPEFKWNTISDTLGEEAESYNIEVSIDEYFNEIKYNTTVYSNSVRPDNEFATGVLHFWRVRGVKYSGSEISYGLWSDVQRFIIAKNIQVGIVEEDGTFIDPAFDDLPEIAHEVLRVFPEKDFSNVALNLKTIFIEISGLLDISTIDPRKFYIEGTHMTEDLNLEDYDPEADQDIDEVNHLYLDGTWSIVLDEDINSTFILFQPYKL